MATTCFAFNGVSDRESLPFPVGKPLVLMYIKTFRMTCILWNLDAESHTLRRLDLLNGLLIALFLKFHSSPTLV